MATLSSVGGDLRGASWEQNLKYKLETTNYAVMSIGFKMFGNPKNLNKLQLIKH